MIGISGLGFWASGVLTFKVSCSAGFGVSIGWISGTGSGTTSFSLILKVGGRFSGGIFVGSIFSLLVKISLDVFNPFSSSSPLPFIIIYLISSGIF